MTDINGNMDATQTTVPVADATLAPGFYTVDSENIEVLGAERGETVGDKWDRIGGLRHVNVTEPIAVLCVRGVGGSTAASHTSGATLERYYPDAPGGTGGGTGVPTGWTQDASDPANVDSEGGGLTVTALVVEGVFGAGGVIVVQDGAGNNAAVTAGDPDPSVAMADALPGSLYMRTNGQAWLKTGAGDGDWTQLGGSPAGAIQVVRVPIAFDTTNLVLTGITAYIPTAGDVLLDSSYLSITTGWDGDSPGISLYSTGDVPGSGDEIIQHFGLGSANSAQGSSTHNSIVTATMANMYLNASGGNHISLDDTAALKLMVDDGAAGDPESMQGEGVFVLIIAPAD